MSQQPFSSDGGFVTAGNITVSGTASPAPTISGFSSVNSENISLEVGYINGGTATVVTDGINSILLSPGAQMDVYGFPFSQTTRGQLTISDVTTPSEANGTWYYQSVNTNAYQIYTDSTYSTLVDASGWSAYTGGGVVEILKQTPPANIVINSNGFLSTFNNTGQLDLPGSLTAVGDVGTDGNLYVHDATFSGNINSAGNFDIDGNASIGGNLFVTGNINFTGNVTQISGNSGVFYGNASTGVGALYAGKTGYTPLPNTVVQMTGDDNAYVQINLQNTNHGNTASMELAITADDGSDVTNYIDIGIASSTWDGTQDNSLGTAVSARDGYMYVQGGSQGGNLILGTTTAGYAVKFNAGGPGSANTVAQITNLGITTTGIVSATGNVRGANINTDGIASVLGNVVSGNVTTTGLVTATGNITGGNLRTTGNVTFTANNANLVFNNTAYISGNANALGRDGSILLSPYTGAGSTFPGVIIGGAGRLLAPNGSVHQVFNASDVTFQVPAKVITGTTSTSTTTGALIITGGGGFSGNVYAGNVYSTGLASVTGNTTVGNLLTAGLVSATGNITTAGNFVGNGAALSNVTVSVAGNIIGTQSNVTLVAGSYSTVIDNTGVATFPGLVTTSGNINSTGFAVGNGAVSNCALAMTPTAGTAGNYAIRDYSTANSVMFFDTTIGSANTGGSFQFRSSNAYTVLANVNTYGVVQPTKPGFRVYGAGNTTNLTTTVNTNGILTGNNYAVDYNQGSYLNTTTGIFTAPVAGLYSVHLVARLSNTASAQIAVVKNYAATSSVQAMWETGANGTTNHFGVSTVSKLAVGDTLVIKVLLGQINFDGNDNWAVAFLG